LIRFQNPFYLFVKSRPTLAAFLFLILSTLLPTKAQARVFSMNSRNFGSYFLLAGGTSVIQKAAFENESVANDYGSSYSLNTGGEFGFVSCTGPLTWRFGLEVIKPSTLTDVSAKLGASTLYLVKSDLNAIIPKVGLEINIKQTPNSRWMIFGTAGTASLTFQNDYSYVTIAPSASHSVKAKSSALMYGGGVGGEFSMMDTTTVMVELGYRALSFTELKYSADVTSFGATAGTSTAHVTGDVLKDQNATNRKIDMTGYYASVGFRFWLL